MVRYLTFDRVNMYFLCDQYQYYLLFFTKNDKKTMINHVYHQFELQDAFRYCQAVLITVEALTQNVEENIWSLSFQKEFTNTVFGQTLFTTRILLAHTMTLDKSTRINKIICANIRNLYRMTGLDIAQLATYKDLKDMHDCHYKPVNPKGTFWLKLKRRQAVIPQLEVALFHNMKSEMDSLMARTDENATYAREMFHFFANALYVTVDKRMRKASISNQYRKPVVYSNLNEEDLDETEDMLEELDDLNLE